MDISPLIISVLETSQIIKCLNMEKLNFYLLFYSQFNIYILLIYIILDLHIHRPVHRHDLQYFLLTLLDRSFFNHRNAEQNKIYKLYKIASKKNSLKFAFAIENRKYLNLLCFNLCKAKSDIFIKSLLLNGPSETRV